MDKLKECFNNAIKDENKGKKHKGNAKVLNSKLYKYHNVI